MPELEAGRVPIEHDTVLSEVWVTENGHRHRVYRGDTKEHIAWKLKKYELYHPELITPGEEELAELLG